MACERERERTYYQVVTPRLLQHVCDQLRRDRGPTFVLLVLSRIREQGDHCRDPLRTSDLAGVYHDADFHQRCIYLPTPAANDVDIVFAHRFDDANIGLAKNISSNLSF